MMVGYRPSLSEAQFQALQLVGEMTSVSPDNWEAGRVP